MSDLESRLDKLLKKGDKEDARVIRWICGRCGTPVRSMAKNKGGPHRDRHSASGRCEQEP